MRTRTRLLLILILLLVPAVMAAAWIGTETMIDATSDAEFCTSCHTMKPFAEAHAADVHGGNNPGGVVAECTQCHLPSGNAAFYLYEKARTGLRDLTAQALYGLHKPDWIGNLEHREQWTYESACRDCHAALETVGDDNPAAEMAHEAYFAGETEGGCVSCHRHVGHADLHQTLADHFEEVEPPTREAASDGEDAAQSRSPQHEE